MDLIRVVIADAHAIYREGVGQLLCRERDIEVVAQATDETQVGKVVEQFKPAVLLLARSCFKDLTALRAIRRTSPRLAILILPADQSEEELVDYLKAGAKGAVSKRETASSLAKAIRVIAAGEVWAGRKVTAHVIEELSALTAPAQRSPHALVGRLTPQELRIAERVAQGCSNRQIAQELHLSEKTVKNHLSNVFQKCAVQNRAQVAAVFLHSADKDKET